MNEPTDRLAELERLEAQATPGPWIRKWAGANVHWIGGDDALQDQRDIDLAVALRNAAPSLIADAREVQREVERLRALLVRWRDAALDGDATELAVLVDDTNDVVHPLAHAALASHNELGAFVAPASTGPNEPCTEADAREVERLRALVADAAKWLALSPSGHTGSLDDRIPWFTHSGISHGADRPDCVVCQWLARAALEPEVAKP